MQKLSEQEIKKRLVKLRNYERLYPVLKRKYISLKQEVKRLKEELATERRERKEVEEKMMLRIEELAEMVFGRKRGGDAPKDKGGKGVPSGVSPEAPSEEKKSARTSASYRRPTPKKEDVTGTYTHPIEACPECGTRLTKLRQIVRYLEDILLPALEGKKIVEQHQITSGFCKKCRKWHAGAPIQKQVCSLGTQVRQRISYGVTVLGMTLEKLQRDLVDTFGVRVSKGELTHMMTEEAAKMQPEYHDIDRRLNEASCVHVDETGWPVQKEGEGVWGWVKTASDSTDTLFRLGMSRGKGNARALITNPGQTLVTDDYASYDHLSEKHQLCWAHPKRKFQDLAESSSLSGKRKAHCQKFYKQFGKLFHDVEQIVESPYDRTRREKEADHFHERFVTLTRFSPHDPEKLRTLKTTFLQNSARYLTCVREPNVPMTNNKAERALRPLVIKRKLSFGSKTPKGAEVMSILLSVCLTTWWKNTDNFYLEYRDILRKWGTA